MQKIGMSLFVGAALLGAIGCDDGVADTAGNAGRCEMICNAVQECTGAEDSDECREECTEKSKEDGFEDKAEECSECIKPSNECTENVVECSDQCAGVVVLSAS